MESRKQASLPGHNIVTTTTDAVCLGDAVQTLVFHHGRYSRALAEVLSTPTRLTIVTFIIPDFRLQVQVCSAWEAEIE